jgi:hypothetical protein
MNNFSIDTELFDRFLKLLDAYLSGSIPKDRFEFAFSEEEWDELYVWIVDLVELIRKYNGNIDKKLKEDKKVSENTAECEAKYKRTLHLKTIISENPFRVDDFEDMVVYLEEEWLYKPHDPV